MIGLVLCGGLGLVLLVYGGWQWRNWRNWRRVGAAPPTIEATTPPPPRLALLIPYRNEAANLARLLGDLGQLDYPNLEVVLIDDHSEDAGPRLVAEAVAKNDGRLRSLALADHLNGRSVVAHKKEALAYAISLTGADLILTTDADCRLPPTLPQHIVAAFGQGNDVVLGPVLTEPPFPSLLPAFQGLDFAAYQLYTVACVAAGRPTLANGACFAFRRELFEAVGGYRGVEHLPSGDDVLLLHKFVHHPGVRFGWHAGPPVLTRAVPTWRGLWQQRLRWAGKAGDYASPELQRGQALAFLTALGLLVTLAYGLLTLSLAVLLFAGAAWLIKAIIDYLLLRDVAHHYGQGELLRWYPLVQLAHPAYLVAVGTGALLGVKVGWKGRE